MASWCRSNGPRRSESTGARPGPDDDRRPSRPARADPSTGRPYRQHARRSPGRPERRHAEKGTMTMLTHRLSDDLVDVESRIRDLVADHLGVGAADLQRSAFLTDALAADSLDLLAVALARRRPTVIPRDDERPVALRARLTPADSDHPWAVERVLLLTPYAAESLADDALRAGAGAHLELRVAPRASETVISRIRTLFSSLNEHGIEVEVRRDSAPG